MLVQDYQDDDFEEEEEDVPKRAKPKPRSKDPEVSVVCEKGGHPV